MHPLRRNYSNVNDGADGLRGAAYGSCRR